MKKALIAVLGILFVVALTSCMDMTVKAPAGKNLTIVNSDVEYVAEKTAQTIYIGYGFMALMGATDTADLLADVPDGSTVAVKVEKSMIDGAITAITYGFVESISVGYMVVK